MEYIVDGLLIVLTVFVVVASLKKGFVSSLLDSFSLIIAGVGAYFCCKPVSEFVYKTFIYDSVRNRFSRVLENVGSGELSTKIDAMVKSLPEGAVRLAEKVGIDVQSVGTGVTANSFKTTEDLINAVVDKIGQSVMMLATEAFVFVILFILFAIIVKAVSKLFGGKINKIPIIGSANQILGALFGVLKCAAMLLAICTVLYLFAGASDDSNVVNAVNGSKICEMINANNPILSAIVGE